MSLQIHQKEPSARIAVKTMNIFIRAEIERIIAATVVKIPRQTGMTISRWTGDPDDRSSPALLR